MPVTCVIGLQWGDEAKGKIVDLLSEQHDVVVRYQGGSNAGHTVVRQGQTFKLSLVPSGIFRPEVQCVIATGVVLNPASLLAEIDGLVGRGIAVAFVATIYGVGVANLFFLPFAGKMRIRLHDDHQCREMMLEGVISILEGMNPRMLEVKLGGFLNAPPQKPMERAA